MGSKFSRNLKHRSKPMVCKQAPAIGPLDERWPPIIATGLCTWQGTQPPYGVFHINGLCRPTWNTAQRQYEARVNTGQDHVDIRCTLAFGNNWFNTYYEYWQAGVYRRAAYSYHHEAIPGEPIYLAADFTVRPDNVHRVLFTLSAFPLV